ncbi:MAG: SagB/ThcOx family dehydrogenase [Bacteroidales bacterium]|nr:SagB/ThcOx family dehydrogenase [Bacteroidales bacterium]
MKHIKLFALLVVIFLYNVHIFAQDYDLESLHQDKQWEPLTSKEKMRFKKPEEELPAIQDELEIIELPEPQYDSETSVEEALLGRRSVRYYKDEPLTIAEISQLLWAAYGITKEVSSPSFLRGGLKTAPSAGALYPLEIYVVSGNVTDLPIGIYKYKPIGHKLAKIVEGDKRAELSEAGYNQKMIKNAAAVIVYSAIFERTTKKYGNRGRERYVCMEAGHSAQNIYLQAYSLDIGMCVCGAFTDIIVKMVLNMTEDEEPLYIIPLGKRKQ